MSYSLEAWKQYYSISDDAHLQLLNILRQVYGIDTNAAITGTSHSPQTDIQTTCGDQPVGPPHSWPEDRVSHSDHRFEVETYSKDLVPSAGRPQAASAEVESLVSCAPCWMRKKKVLGLPAIGCRLTVYSVKGTRSASTARPVAFPTHFAFEYASMIHKCSPNASAATKIMLWV